MTDRDATEEQRFARLEDENRYLMRRLESLEKAAEDSRNWWKQVLILVAIRGTLAFGSHALVSRLFDRFSLLNTLLFTLVFSIVMLCADFFGEKQRRRRRKLSLSEAEFEEIRRQAKAR